jgi:hypothetical protein
MDFAQYLPSTRLTRPICGLLALLLAASAAFATPYWTPEQMRDDWTRSHPTLTPPTQLSEVRQERRALDDLEYFTHYRMLCDFLVGLQYDGAGNNFGGQREGESGSDFGIIQTDNTQEAIRVWSRYAIWTGDTARYGQYIRNAQRYCRFYPAWREEGGGYYAAHNCGWGFEAAYLYRQAYQDTSWNWYADSCAWWVTRNALAYNPNSTDLTLVEPLAEGLAIGGLYPHALYRQRTDWQTFALAQGRRLRTWFQSNPARFNNNEVWALCGGTALWGLCESLFAAYPDSGQQWLAQYGAQLDGWESNGTWNHSFCTWYCNAQNAVFEITHDSTYWRNAVAIADSLIGLDTDVDGGIPPGRTFPVTNDHSWVSAYMGWMGMERIIFHEPASDAAAVQFISPDPLLPSMAGDSLPVSVRVRNNSFTPQTLMVRVDGPLYADSVTVTVGTGRDSVVSLARPWVLPNDNTLPDYPVLLLRVRTTGDGHAWNDTLSAAFDVRHGVTLSGVVRGENNTEIGPCTVDFYHSAYPDSLWASTVTNRSGEYTTGLAAVMTGTNTIRVRPPVQQMLAETTIIVTSAPAQTVNFTLRSTEIALIDDDGADTVETFYQASADSLSDRVRVWSTATDGPTDLWGVPTVMWFTGRETQNTLTGTEQATLQTYLNSGGHLLLSGQNIIDELDWTPAFLTTVLHCTTRTASVSQRRVAGMAGNPISNGLDMYIVGAGGAQNQTSPASMYPLEGSTEILHYSTGQLEVCGVSGFYGTGRYVFLSFGLEAVSGSNRSTTRRAFMSRCLDWFADSTSHADRPAPLPEELSLQSVYPNPFNPTTTIQFSAPRTASRVQLELFNLLGQRVATLYDGGGTGRLMSVQWNGKTDSGLDAASGHYLVRLRADHDVLVRRIEMVR